MCHNPNLQIDLSLDILEHYCNLNDLTILRLSNTSLSLTKTLTYEMYCYSQTGNVRKKLILFTDKHTLNLRCSVVPKLGMSGRKKLVPFTDKHTLNLRCSVVPEWELSASRLWPYLGFSVLSLTISKIIQSTGIRNRT